MNKNDYNKTVASVDLDRFVGKWYVNAGRFTFLENGAHNPIEEYSWAENREYIKVDFRFNKDSFDGKIKRIPQKAYIFNKETNAHWKIKLLWILKLDYLVIALAPDYSWTVVGIPSQKYVWIMSKDPHMSEESLTQIIEKLKELKYDHTNIVRAPHQ